MFSKKLNLFWCLGIGIVSLLNSCTVNNMSNMIKKDTVLPVKGHSIIYGKFSGLPDSGSYDGFSLYDRKQDKLYSFCLKTGFERETSSIFAFDIPAGKYELFSYSETSGGRSTLIKTYYWINEFSEIYTITNEPSDEIIKKKNHTKIEIPANKNIYVGDWSYNISHTEPTILNNKSNTDLEAIIKFPYITNNSISIIPITKVYDYFVYKHSKHSSLVIIYISNIMLIDNKTTNNNGVSSIYLVNKEFNTIFKDSTLYSPNKLCFINNVPIGNYKIKRLNFPTIQSPISANFTEESIPENINILEGKLVLKTSDRYFNNFDYQNASIDFLINKPGIYYLGSYDIVIDIRNRFNGKTTLINRPDRIKDDLNTIKKYLVDFNTGWDMNNIYVVTNAFYSTNFILR